MEPSVAIGPLCGPTCKLGLARTQTELEFQVGPERGNNKQNIREFSRRYHTKNMSSTQKQRTILGNIKLFEKYEEPLNFLLLKLVFNPLCRSVSPSKKQCNKRGPSAANVQKWPE